MKHLFKSNRLSIDKRLRLVSVYDRNSFANTSKQMIPDMVENRTEWMNCLRSPGFWAVCLKMGMHKAEKTAQR